MILELLRVRSLPNLFVDAWLDEILLEEFSQKEWVLETPI